MACFGAKRPFHQHLWGGTLHGCKQRSGTLSIPNRPGAARRTAGTIPTGWDGTGRAGRDR